ncbi:hypothetical protein [Arsenicibacter rosenii]|uniref:Outer membrane protein beta-barrel domain-containing protein n=1 Tax=Arsenicibacter rosenii TaxID=1750698 RepID=A0A1S2VCB9_9BACT|nr:hypothetical protein [Arsenicibacter rosenii]OIN56407.1 hypothetical protein BLX24_24860 [Arsenicibacter rosenii]
MKRLSMLLWLLMEGLTGFAQSVTEYYQPPAERLGLISPLPEVPGWDQDKRKTAYKRANFERLITRYGNAYITDRWYVGFDGFLRTDKGSLSQTFNGLVSTKAVSQLGWSAMFGWVGREKWAAEIGYARSAVHTLFIINQQSPLRIQADNDRQGIVFRGRRLMRFSQLPQLGGAKGGLWLGLGVWLLPNAPKDPSVVHLIGYSSRTPRSRPDTLRLVSNTTISPHVTGMVEASAEYIANLGGRTEMSVFVRKNRGLGSSLTTNLTYQVNSNEQQQAWLRGTGTGWSVGIVLRYSYGRQYDLRRMHRVGDLQGNRKQK